MTWSPGSSRQSRRSADRPDDRARHLRQTASRTRAIGFILVDVANPFFSSILRGIEEVARKHDYLVLAGEHRRSPRTRGPTRRCVRRPPGGRPHRRAVRTGAGLLQAELERGTPVVFLDLEPEDLTVDLVRSDHRGGAVLATQHLQATATSCSSVTTRRSSPPGFGCRGIEKR